MDTSSLMEQILSSDNLNKHICKSYRNKGAGSGQNEIHRTQKYLCKERRNHKGTVEQEKYKPQPVRRVECRKPDGGVRNQEYQQ